MNIALLGFDKDTNNTNAIEHELRRQGHKLTGITNARLLLIPAHCKRIAGAVTKPWVCVVTGLARIPKYPKQANAKNPAITVLTLALDVQPADLFSENLKQLVQIINEQGSETTPISG